MQKQLLTKYSTYLSLKLLGKNRREFPQFDSTYEKPTTKNHAKWWFIECFTLRSGERQGCLLPPFVQAVLLYCKTHIPKKDYAGKNHRTYGESALGA